MTRLSAPDGITGGPKARQAPVRDRNLPRIEAIGGRPRSVIPGQMSHQSPTSRNTNTREAMIIIGIAWS
jgi:hypothetical protein